MPRIRVAAKADRTDPATGVVFDSKGELGRWHELQLLLRAGEITELRRQVAFVLYAASGPDGRAKRVPVKLRSGRYPNGRDCVYVADFCYHENGQDIYEDFKGWQTPESRLKIAFFECCYGVQVRITKKARR